jgi:hypothetical protein
VAATPIALDYFEVAGVGMFLERSDPNPRKGVHVLWSGEKVRPDCPLRSPTVDEGEMLEPGKYVVSLPGLIRMKLMANLDQDRVHLRDLIDVGLVSRDLLQSLRQNWRPASMDCLAKLAVDEKNAIVWPADAGCAKSVICECRKNGLCTSSAEKVI